jgi:hypothetical protein
MSSILSKARNIEIYLSSVSFTSLSDEEGELLSNRLLSLEGVTEIECYDEIIIYCNPDGDNNVEFIENLERIEKSAYTVLRDHGAISDEYLLIEEKVKEALEYDRLGYENKTGMVPSVFKAKNTDGGVCIGFNLQPEDTQVGDRFHYDHGAGIDKNTDGQVLWMIGKE